MAESKQPKKRHVKAARDWLQKAEQSFEREDEARGDLDMMLARAELARAAEMKRDRRPGRLRAWAKEGLAAAAALFLVAAGLFFWQPEAVPATSPPPAQSARPAPEIPRERAAPLALPGAQEPAAASAREAAVEAVEKEEENRAAVVAEEEPQPKVALPDAEMRRLMREAGKSLRGQPPFGNE